MRFAPNPRIGVPVRPTQARHQGEQTIGLLTHRASTTRIAFTSQSGTLDHPSWTRDAPERLMCSCSVDVVSERKKADAR